MDSFKFIILCTILVVNTVTMYALLSDIVRILGVIRSELSDIEKEHHRLIRLIDNVADKLNNIYKLNDKIDDRLRSIDYNTGNIQNNVNKLQLYSRKKGKKK